MPSEEGDAKEKPATAFFQKLSRGLHPCIIHVCKNRGGQDLPGGFLLTCTIALAYFAAASVKFETKVVGLAPTRVLLLPAIGRQRSSAIT